MQDATWQPPDNDGIRDRTRDKTNLRIDRETRGAIDEAQSSPEAIRARIAEIDAEWNVDRALMMNFAIAATITSSLAMRNLVKHGRLGGWGKLFFTQLGFLAYHSAKRWCPPLPVLRLLGFRSDREIAAERCALQAKLDAKPRH